MILETLPDIPRFLTGFAEWAACMVYILFLRHRVQLPRLIPLAILALAFQIGVQEFAGRLPLSLWAAGMIVSVAGMYLFIVAVARVSLPDAGYFCARALVLAELVAALHWQIHCFLFQPAEGLNAPWKIAFFLFVYATAFVGAWFIESRHFRKTQPLNVTLGELASTMAIALVTFFMSNISFLNANTPFSGRLGFEIFYIRTLVDLCGFVALYAQQEQRLQQHAKAEVKAIDGILRSQHGQYLQSKRSIEVVNRKYHDLKHQIGVIRAESDPGKKASYLDDLEASIKNYARQADTGNGVLDVVLTTKSMECGEHDINFTYVADGSVLDFMSAMDISAVFGNALDNAIEGALQVPDPDRRLIKMALFAKDRFAMVTFENSFSGELQMDHGDIVTRHADRDLHGYGLKSLRHTAEKYGGSMTVVAEDQWFVVRILLPIPPGTTSDDRGR